MTGRGGASAPDRDRLLRCRSKESTGTAAVFRMDWQRKKGPEAEARSRRQRRVFKAKISLISVRNQTTVKEEQVLSDTETFTALGDVQSAALRFFHQTYTVQRKTFPRRP